MCRITRLTSVAWTALTYGYRSTGLICNSATDDWANITELLNGINSELSTLDKMSPVNTGTPAIGKKTQIQSCSVRSQASSSSPSVRSQASSSSPTVVLPTTTEPKQIVERSLGNYLASKIIMSRPVPAVFSHLGSGNICFLLSQLEAILNHNKEEAVETLKCNKRDLEKKIEKSLSDLQKSPSEAIKVAAYVLANEFYIKTPELYDDCLLKKENLDIIPQMIPLEIKPGGRKRSDNLFIYLDKKTVNCIADSYFYNHAVVLTFTGPDSLTRASLMAVLIKLLYQYNKLKQVSASKVVKLPQPSIGPPFPSRQTYQSLMDGIREKNISSSDSELSEVSSVIKLYLEDQLCDYILENPISKVDLDKEKFKRHIYNNDSTIDRLIKEAQNKWNACKKGDYENRHWSPLNVSYRIHQNVSEESLKEMIKEVLQSVLGNDYVEYRNVTDFKTEWKKIKKTQKIDCYLDPSLLPHFFSQGLLFLTRPSRSGKTLLTADEIKKIKICLLCQLVQILQRTNCRR